MLIIDSIAQIHDLIQDESPKHPLISVIDFSQIEHTPKQLPPIAIGLYCVVFKNDSNCQWKYGRKNYDFQEGTLVFLSPGQRLEVDIVNDEKEKNGWGLFFHPDLIRRYNLDLSAPEYSFFSYDVSEALHISDKEKLIILDSLKKIEEELSLNIDKHSQRLLVSNIELLLNYCLRYYDRQFITRENMNHSTVVEFEKFLKEYFKSEELAKKGLPSVIYCADKMNISPNYLSDLLKKETGKTTLEHIHFHLIEKAKDMLLGSKLSVKEIAFELGFEYPQHFNKIFKNKTGTSPLEYRKLN